MAYGSPSLWQTLGAKESACILSAEELADLGESAPPETKYYPPPLKTKCNDGYDMRVGDRAKKRRRVVRDVKPAAKATAVQPAAQPWGKRTQQGSAGGGTKPKEPQKDLGPRPANAPRPGKPMIQESDLPPGWRLERRLKNNGESAGLQCIAPDGTRFISFKEAKAFIMQQQEQVSGLDARHLLSWLRGMARDGLFNRTAGGQDMRMAGIRARHCRSLRRV